MERYKRLTWLFASIATVNTIAANYVIKKQEQKIQDLTRFNEQLMQLGVIFAQHTPSEIVEKEINRIQFEDIVGHFEGLGEVN